MIETCALCGIPIGYPWNDGEEVDEEVASSRLVRRFGRVWLVHRRCVPITDMLPGGNVRPVPDETMALPFTGTGLSGRVP